MVMPQLDLFGEAEDLPEVAMPPARCRKSLRRTDWRADLVPLQPQLPMACPGFENLFDWTDEEIEAMREGLLFASIRDVCDSRLSEWSREEIWDWIDSDEIHPFSFRVCVDTYGEGVDYEELREKIRWLARKLLEMNGEDIQIDFRSLFKTA